MAFLDIVIQQAVTIHTVEQAVLRQLLMSTKSNQTNDYTRGTSEVTGDLAKNCPSSDRMNRLRQRHFYLTRNAKFTDLYP